MKKFISVVLAFTMVTSALAGCSSQATTTAVETTSEAVVEEKAMPEKIEGEDYNEYGGADAYGNAGDHADSIYYGNPDFYNMESNDHLTILSNFKTMQQTTEWSCGPASMLMMLQRFGITDYTEMDLAILGNVSVDEDTEGALPGSANNYHEYGAGVEKMYNIATSIEGIKVVETSFVSDYTEDMLLTVEGGASGNNAGNLPGTFSSSALYASENSDDTEAWVDDAKDSYFVQWITGHLNDGNGIMVAWGDWDGHWQVIIGYDTMGTPSIGDDIIIFADPYDTSDHWQDGYYYYPAERWFYMWNERNVVPKPYQLQQYIIIGKE